MLCAALLLRSWHHAHCLLACVSPCPHPLQIERRDYEGQLRASQSQSRSGGRSSGAMAGADA
jgi:hypothetical protein